MKKFSQSIAILLISSAGFSQCTDIFISEYVEASGNDKAIEIYNPTANPVDLRNYRLIRWDNGSLTANTAGSDEIQPLGGIIPPYSAWVATLNVTGDGTTTNPATTDSLKAYADTLFTTNCAPNTGNLRTLCFNGDDALTLEKIIDPQGSQTDPANWTNVDIFACVGERPKNSAGTYSPTGAWTALAPYSSMPSGYNSSVQGPYFKQYWTQAHTLIRKYDVQAGITTNPAPETFNVSVQWDSLAEGTYTNLGTHDCVCKLLSVPNYSNDQNVRIYPNPSTDLISLSSDNSFSKVQIMDLNGKIIRTENGKSSGTKTLNIVVADLPAGMYHLRIFANNGKLSVIKFVKK